MMGPGRFFPTPAPGKRPASPLRGWALFGPRGAVRERPTFHGRPPMVENMVRKELVVFPPDGLKAIGRGGARGTSSTHCFHLFQFLLGKFLKPNEGIFRFADTNKLVQLNLDGGRISILRILDKEHHQERNDGRAGVDH